jgi:hypothetical protein
MFASVIIAAMATTGIVLTIKVIRRIDRHLNDLD